MGLWTYQVHPHRKQKNVKRETVNEVKLRLIGVALLVAMISEDGVQIASPRSLSLGSRRKRRAPVSNRSWQLNQMV